MRRETFVSELPEWDSLAQLAVMSMLEQDYAVVWNPDLFLNISTVNDIINIVNVKDVNFDTATQDCEFNSSSEQFLPKKIGEKITSFSNSKEELLYRIANILGVDPSHLRHGVKLSELPEWDSLSCLALIATLEQEYDVSMSPDEFLRLSTIDDILNIALGVNKVELETDTSCEQVLSTDVQHAGFIVHNIMGVADRVPTRNALVFSSFSISYRQFSKGILSTVSLLRERNVTKGDVVAIFAEKLPEFFYCYFAVQFLGAIVLNLDPSINRERLKYILNETHPVLIVGKSENNDLTFSEISIYRASSNPSAVELLQDDIAEIMFTTGTTGVAKGVQLSHGNQIAAVEQINRFIGVGQNDTEVVSLPIHHSFGMGRVRCLLSVGATVICVDGFSNTKELFSALSENNATGWAFVPAAWAYLQQTTGNLITKYAKNLRYIEIGSAPMPLEKKRELMNLFPFTRICMHYGLTEASRSSFIEFHSEVDYLNTAGKASPNTQIAIIADDGIVQPIYSEGEICIKGAHVMKTYLNSPDVSEYFHGEYFRTGDWGMMDDEGYLHILSRTKDIINSGGKKISPEEVENVLSRLPGIMECACVSAPDPNGILGEVVKAILISDGTDKPSLEDIRNGLIGKLESYKLPTCIEWRDILPKTDSGKIKRNLLRS